MRISYLASAVLAIWVLPLSTPAYAQCSSVNCASGGNTIIYGSGSYGSGSYNAQSTSSNSMSSSHVSRGIDTRFGTTSSAVCASGQTRLGNGYCASTTSSSSAGFSSGYTASSSASYGSTSHSTGQVVPFTTTVSKISNFKVPGMGNNEYLSPTTCPTNVYNPGGNKVLGCYKVVKPVQTVRPVPQIRYQQVRVVRPIIYVRYPVPMPVPMPICRSQTICASGCAGTTYSRYGNVWPRGGNHCRSW